MDRRKNVSWETQSLIQAWSKHQQDSDWASFSTDMLKAGAPDGYSDSDLRRQIGLLKHQLTKQGYKAPLAPDVPKKPKGSTIANIASELGLEKL